jgi:hypothetical protein
MMLSLFSAALVAAAAMPQAPAAPDSATIAIVITHAGTQKPLENAELRLTGVNAVLRTDYMGEVNFKWPRESRFALNVRLVGYTAIDTAFAVGAVDWMHIVLEIRPRAPAPVASRLAAFETRRSTGRGKYLTPEQMREAHDKKLIDVVSRIPGVIQDVGSNGAVKVVARTGPTSIQESNDRSYGYIVRGESRSAVTTRTGNGYEDGVKPGYCEIAVFIDGIYIRDPEIGNLRAAAFEAVEFYTASNVPPEFKRPGAQCGIMLLWSR